MYQKLQTSAFFRPLAPSSWPTLAIGIPLPPKKANVLYGWPQFVFFNMPKKSLCMYVTLKKGSLEYETVYQKFEMLVT